MTSVGEKLQGLQIPRSTKIKISFPPPTIMDLLNSIHGSPGGLWISGLKKALVFCNLLKDA